MTETLDELDRRHGDERRAGYDKGPALARRHDEERKSLIAWVDADEREKDKNRYKKNLRERMGLFWDRRCVHCGQGDTFPNVGTCGWPSNPGGGDPPCLTYVDGDRSRAEVRDRSRMIWTRWLVAAAIIITALFLWGMKSKVKAHDSAAWIMDGGYATKGIRCCNENDCGPVSATKIGAGRLPGEYLWLPTLEKIDPVRVPGTSPDGRWWRCRVTFAGGLEDHQQTRCLFPPAPGT